MSTERKFPDPQPYTDEERPEIALTPVESSQVKGIGYDPATQTLAVQFKHGKQAIYHYPEVSAKTHADFMASDSVGKFFGKHISMLPFKKCAPPPVKKAA